MTVNSPYRTLLGIANKGLMRLDSAPLPNHMRGLGDLATHPSGERTASRQGVW